MSILEQARELCPIALHGVGLSIGSVDDLDLHYLSSLKSLAERINPFLISDHLSFSRFQGHNSHDLLPVAYTKSMLRTITDRVNRVQDVLGRQFMLENPSAYISYAHHDYSEVDFICELISATGMGLLLDVNNLLVNQLNLGCDAVSYLQSIPSGTVGQIHVAGHSVSSTEWGVVRIDTHDQPILEETFQLAKLAMARFPDASVMIEWDDHIPPLAELMSSLQRLRNLYQETNHTSNHRSNHLTSYLTNKVVLNPDRSSTSLEVEHQEAQFFELTVDDRGVVKDDPRLTVLDAGLNVPRHLGARVYNQAYFERLHEVLKTENPILAAVTTEEGFRAIAAHYFLQHPSRSYSINGVSRSLGPWLHHAEIDGFDFGVAMAVLSDIATYDAAKSQVFMAANPLRQVFLQDLETLDAEEWLHVSFNFCGHMQLLKLSHDICQFDKAIQNEQDLAPPLAGDHYVLIYRQDGTVQTKILEPWQYELILSLQRNRPLGSVLEEIFGSDISAESGQSVILFLCDLIGLGLIAEVVRPSHEAVVSCDSVTEMSQLSSCHQNKTGSEQNCSEP